METLETLPHVQLNGLMTYSDYYSLVQLLALQNKTTGPDPSPDHINATKLNAQRMKRLNKQVVIEYELARQLELIPEKWNWTILAESWCGDGAQNIPVLAKMAELVPDKIDLRIILRDENPDFMNAYLTNNVKAIPKLVCFSAEREMEIGTWGPRPAVIQERVRVLKLNASTTHEEFVHTLHTWYAEDKGESLKNEFEDILKNWRLSVV